MKRLATALAFALALSTVAPSAFAEEFRAPEAQTFTQQELQQYGLSASDAAQVAAYQEQGYNVVVMSPEEAQQYQKGPDVSVFGSQEKYKATHPKQQSCGP